MCSFEPRPRLEKPRAGGQCTYGKGFFYWYFHRESRMAGVAASA